MIIELKAIILVWDVGILCIPIMKKITPGSRDVHILYLVYVLFICILFTLWMYICAVKRYGQFII